MAEPMGEIKAEIARKEILGKELEQLDRLTALARLDGARLKRALTAQASHLQALLGREIPQARQLLRKLLAGSLRSKPVAGDGRRGHRTAAPLGRNHLWPEDA